MKTLATLTFVCCLPFVNAQITTETLPSFYNTYEGNKVRSVDMISSGDSPVVLYTTYEFNGVHCKEWNGKEWKAFGSFPEIKERGFVNLEMYKGGYYAIIQEGSIWSLFKLNQDEMSWDRLASLDDSSDHFLSRPELAFNNGNPVIYEQHYASKELRIFSLQGEQLEPLILSDLDKIASDFVYDYDETLNASMMTWLNQKGHLEMYFVNAQSEVSNQMKGLDKKDVSSPLGFRTINNEIYFFWLKKNYQLACAQLDEEKNEWVISESASFGHLNYQFSNDDSMISVDRDSQLPVFNRIENEGWAKDTTVGKKKIESNKTIRLVLADESFFMLAFDLEGNTIVQTFD